MTVLDKLKGEEFIAGWYLIGFFNTDTGRDDETIYKADTPEELDELFTEFCRENHCEPNHVHYVEWTEDEDEDE